MNFGLLFIVVILCSRPIICMEKPPQPSAQAPISQAFILTIANQIQTLMKDLTTNPILQRLGTNNIMASLQNALAATLAPHPDLSLIITHLQEAKQFVQKTGLKGKQPRLIISFAPLTDKIQNIIDLLELEKVKESSIASQEEEDLKKALQMIKEQLGQLEETTKELAEQRITPQIPPLSPAAKPMPAPSSNIEEPKAKKAQQKVEEVPIPGLPNPDNRCFMNAALQSIFSLDAVVDVVLAQAHRDPDFYTSNPMANAFVKLTQSFREHMAQLENKEKEVAAKEPYSPTEFCMSTRARMGLKPAEQADSGEFLQFLIDSLLHPAPGKTNEQLERLLFFTITNNEEGVPHQEEVFRLQVAPPWMSEKERRQARQKNLPPVTLKECIDNFFVPEIQPNQKIRTPVLSSLSPYFIVELTRKKLNEKTKKFEKITTPVIFPLEGLKLTAHLLFGVPSERVYRLKAFIVHTGSAEGGHYYAYVLYGNQWYRADDNAIRKAPLSEIEQIAKLGYDKGQNETPTIFFYETNF